MRHKKENSARPIEVESEKSFQRFLDNLPYPSVIHESGKYVYANTAAAKLFKARSPKELIGKNSLTIIHPSYKEVSRERIKEVYEKGFSPERENLIVDKKGEVLIVKIAGTLINYQGKPSILSTVQNINDQRNFEEQLKSSEEQYRQLVENINEGIIKFDPNEVITYANKRFCKMVEYSAKELIGKVGHNLLVSSKDSMKLVHEAIQQRLNGISSKYELELKTKSGKVIWISMNGTPVFNEQGVFEGSIGVIADITRDKKNQDKLERSEQRYRTLVEKMNEGIIMVDNDEVIEYVNDRFCEIVGFKYKELVGERVEEILIHCMQSRKRVRKMVDLRRDGISSKYEVRFKRKSGEWIDVSMNGTPLYGEDGKVRGSMGILTDITEARLAEEALLKSEEKYRTLVEKMNEGVIRLNADDTIEYVNARLCKILGYTVKDLVGKNRFDILKVDSGSMKEIKKSVAIRKRGGSSKYELKHRRKSGEWIWISINGTPFVDDRGKITGSLGIVTDITDQKRFETEINELNFSLEERVIQRTAELEKANTEIRSLLREMHHRVKNNLQIVSSLLNMQAASVGDAFVAEAFKESQDRIQTMAFIHESLYLNESMSEISVKKYLEQLVKDRVRVNADLTNKVNLKTTFPDIHFKIDTMLPIGLLLNELVTNSLKHAFPNNREGRIVVSLDLRSKKSVILSYSDNGIGFPLEKTGDSSGSLGLILIESFAMQLDGKLKRLDKPGTHYEIRFEPV